MAEFALRPGRPSKSIEKLQIYAIARQLFSLKGYDGTTLDDIAIELKIRKSSLIHHCKSKKTLYFKIFEIITGDIKAFIEKARSDNDSFMQKIDTLGHQITIYFGSNPASAKLLMRELLGGGPAFSGVGKQTVQDILKFTSGFLKEGIDSGVFAKQDPDQLALSIIGMHLYYFSATESTADFLGKNSYTDKGIRIRSENVIKHVKKLVL